MDNIIVLFALTINSVKGIIFNKYSHNCY